MKCLITFIILLILNQLPAMFTGKPTIYMSREYVLMITVLMIWIDNYLIFRNIKNSLVSTLMILCLFGVLVQIQIMRKDSKTIPAKVSLRYTHQSMMAKDTKHIPEIGKMVEKQR